MESSTSNDMICTDCFRSHGEKKPLLCRNPKCLFFRHLPVTIGNEATGYSRPYFGSGPDGSAEVADSFLMQSAPATSWSYKPITRKQQSPVSNRIVSFALDTGHPLTTSTSAFAVSRAQSVSTMGNQLGIFEDVGRSRSRLTSLPVGSEYAQRISSNPVSELDDAFHAYSYHNPQDKAMSTSEKDSGTCSPYSRPSSSASSDLWLERTSSSSDGLFGMASLRANLPHLDHMASKASQSSLYHSSPPDKGSLLRRFSQVDSSPPVSMNKITTETTYSRKVFIGGLPPDLDQDDIRMSFQHYGSLTVDWPHRLHSKSTIPPRGYAFLLFVEESSVKKLVHACVCEGNKLFTFISTSSLRKKVQIRPWSIADSWYMVPGETIDCRKAVFIGGVPRQLKAKGLAEVMMEKFGSVSFVAIDCDDDLKYPKGAGCVVFTTYSSFIAAVSSRFMQLSHAGLEKKVELKPYILDDQMCDECHGIQSNGKPAPFFCGSITCLQYYCEQCWATVHSLPTKQSHRPMLKDIGDRDKI